jgi:hypothetical protein
MSFEPPTHPTPLQEQIQQTLFSISLDQPRPKLREDGMVKARIGQLQTECVFPCEAITHRVSRLPIGQAFHKLKHGHQCQAPRGESRLTMSRKQISKYFISVNGSQRITSLDESISTGKDSVSHTSYFFWNWWKRQRFE